MPQGKAVIGQSGGPTAVINRSLVGFIKEATNSDFAGILGARHGLEGMLNEDFVDLSNLSDQRMSKAKSGQWWVDQGQRRLANNSVAYTEKPDFEAYLNEMRNLYESKAGERGLFSRIAAQKIAARNGRRDPDQDFGTNPCSEIILRSNEFCNLSEVVVRADDTLETLKKKTRIATIIGTLQSTLTDFRYLRVRWKRITEE